MNRSPKPFSSKYGQTISGSKSEESLISGNTHFTEKSASATSVVNSNRNGKTAAEKIAQIHSPSKKNTTRTPEPSTRPMSAKLASFEQKITENTPKTGFSRTAQASKQVNNSAVYVNNLKCTFDEILNIIKELLNSTKTKLNIIKIKYILRKQIQGLHGFLN